MCSSSPASGSFELGPDSALLGHVGDVLTAAVAQLLHRAERAGLRLPGCLAPSASSRRLSSPTARPADAGAALLGARWVRAVLEELAEEEERFVAAHSPAARSPGYRALHARLLTSRRTCAYI